MQKNIPFLSMPMISGIKVNSQEGFEVDKFWRVVREMGDRKRTQVLFMNKKEGLQKGMLKGILIDFGVFGKILIQPLFETGESSHVWQTFMMFDATFHLFAFDNQIHLMPEHAKSVRKRYIHEMRQTGIEVNEMQQDGIEVLNDEHVTRIVQVAQLIVMQRALGIV